MRYIIILLIFIIAFSNSFCMKTPPPSIIGSEHAALFTMLATQAQEILKNPKIYIDDEDTQDEITPVKRSRQKCPVCNEVVRNLSTHLLSSHPNEKPYKCNLCTYSSKLKFPLVTHKRTHGESPYFCNHCVQPFTTDSNWRVHMRTKHSEVVNEDI